MRIHLSPLAGILLLGLSACTNGLEDPKTAKSPSFQAGYSDGCATANERGADFRARQVRDDALYKTDDGYRAGWSNGFSSCRTTNTAPGTQPGTNPLGGPLPGTH